MIKFFRKIRQRLLTENKFSKYLIYAVGEIVLVVIGILIALSINKYNENIRAKQFELKMLKQLEQDLLENRTEYEKLRTVYEEKSRSCDFILNHIKGRLALTDSLLYHFRNSQSQIVFTPINTGYVFLKTSGLSEIKNDSIRIAITKLYEQEINMLVSQNQRLLTIQRNYIEPFMIEHFKGLKYEREYEFSDFKIHYSSSSLPIDYDALILNETYANIIALKQRRLLINLRYLIEYQKNLEALITLLRKEIEKKENT